MVLCISLRVWKWGVLNWPGGETVSELVLLAVAAFYCCLQSFRLRVGVSKVNERGEKLGPRFISGFAFACRGGTALSNGGATTSKIVPTPFPKVVSFASLTSCSLLFYHALCLSTLIVCYVGAYLGIHARALPRPFFLTAFDCVHSIEAYLGRNFISILHFFCFLCVWLINFIAKWDTNSK